MQITYTLYSWKVEENSKEHGGCGSAVITVIIITIIVNLSDKCTPVWKFLKHGLLSLCRPCEYTEVMSFGWLT